MEELPVVVRVALQNIINENGKSDYHKILISPACNKGDNFIAVIHRIEVKNSDQSVLNLICKIPPSDGTCGNNKKVQICFEREVYVYNTILECFRKFQICKLIPEIQLFTSRVQCYAADSTNAGAYLILEDLKAKSFQMFDKKDKLDRAHVQLVIEGLAKFHAISYAMKDQQPEEFRKCSEIPEVMTEMMGKEVFYNLCNFGLNQALAAIQNNGFGPEYRDRVMLIKENCEEVMHTCFNGIGSENFRVVTHGDCWNNNMMFRYQNNIPCEVRFIDWQVSRYTSPVADLSYYLYSSTEKELLDEHFDDLMDIYHINLCKSIRLLGSDPQRLYPYEVFQNDLKKFAKLGVIFCTFGLNFVLAKPESAPDVGEMSNINDCEYSLEEYMGFKDEYTKSIYERRIIDVIKHAAKRNFI